ncbi:membrane dipeptidase [Sphingomonas changnyeongensis]|uniref:Membrane dipeptidase n=1 Tax=Sphingomonas changnyeongensis TaxID=2698679 RepID=A0A7Z2NTS3_9SPHN|nr:dipeptidase [Sphingomonas changnyeongensis]QHL89705.1 membrane dipeptidase [Sphingomonas changnyeongensis]
MAWPRPAATMIAAFALTACAAADMPAAAPAENPARDARALHMRLLALDTHLDTPVNLGRPGWRIADRHDYASDLSQVDLPRMAEGGLDGGFFVIYTEQGPLDAAGYARAADHAWTRVRQIRAMVDGSGGRMALATSAAEIERQAARGRIVVLQSIENSYPLGDSVAALADFHRAGVRLAGPVHNGDNQFADAASGGRSRHGGLSALGRQWVAEMNRLGMVIDASHASDAAFDQMLALSRAPIILSHSGPRAVFDHPRNLDDQRLKALAARGGVVFVNSIFLAPVDRSPARQALWAKREAMDRMDPAEQRAVALEWAALDRLQPYNPATFDQFMASLLHCLKLVGPDHVGIGADWDGGGGVTGMIDVAALPRITAALRAAGYSDADIKKVWSGNLLRVMRAAEGAAR